jgi:hypothetical protein
MRSTFRVGEAFMQQTPEDFEQHLKEELQYLHNLTQDFDGGFDAAAKKMAVAYVFSYTIHAIQSRSSGNLGFSTSPSMTRPPTGTQGRIMRTTA